MPSAKQAAKKTTPRRRGPSARKPLTPSQKMRLYRERMRRAGFRPLQTWVIDHESPRIIKQLKKEDRILSKRTEEVEILDWLEQAADTDGWV